MIEEAIVDVSEERFLGYLSQLKSVNFDNLEGTFREKIKTKYGKNKLITRARENLDYLDSSAVSQTELINRVVVALLKNDNPGTVEKLSQYINRKHLLREEAKVKLAKGQQSAITNLYNIFTV